MKNLPFILLLFLLFCLQPAAAQLHTQFSKSAGEYTRLLDALEKMLIQSSYNDTMLLGGKERHSFVLWIRDHVHVMKAMKYLHPDLVKRGYTLDTWDFMQLPTSREEYTRQGGDIQKGIFDIDENTPMGIMHGDNSGMYAACRQLAHLYEALGNESEAAAWDHQAAIFRLRTNALCWNGKFYAHFVEDDPQPSYLHMDQQNTLSLSNPYDINRGLPTQEMAASIIQTYRNLKAENQANSFAEWYGVYPAVAPHFADYEPGSYMNGGVNTIVGGELAKAAFQHGFEAYGVDILNRMLALVDKHDGDLPVAYRPDGTVDAGIPDNWGQAAVYSALIEGLAGVVDPDHLFNAVEISPRWMAAGVDEVEVSVVYGPSEKHITYAYQCQRSEKKILLDIEGDAEQIIARILLPAGVSQATARANGKNVTTSIDTVESSNYLVIKDLSGKTQEIDVSF